MSRRLRFSVLAACLIGFALLTAGCNQDSNSLADVDPLVPDLPGQPAENGYHWDGEADPYYEGWYFKVSDPRTHFSFFFVYGVIFPGDPSTGESFVHLGGGPAGDVIYVPAPLDRFQARADKLDVTVGSATATADRIRGVVSLPDFSADWDLDIEPGVGWEKTMGDLTGVPGIDVNWDVIHLRATATGTIRWNGAEFALQDAVLYADHNWGLAFPEYWMWMQGAHFTGGQDALAAAGGIVHSLFGTGEAYMIGYFRDGLLHTYRTQDGDSLEGGYADGIWTLVGDNGDTRISVWATADPWTMLTLYGPTRVGMAPILSESIEGLIGVTYFVRVGDGWVEEAERVTDLAGVEVGGVWP